MLSPKDIDQYIGARLRHLRKSRGLTQEELGEIIGRSLQQVNKYENGSNRVSANVIWRLSAYFDVEVSYFFQGLNDEPNLAISPDRVEVADAALRLQDIKDENVRRKIIALIDTFTK